MSLLLLFHSSENPSESVVVDITQGFQMSCIVTAGYPPSGPQPKRQRKRVQNPMLSRLRM